MRTFGRRAAIGATTLALLFAAAGTSVATVRAARDEGGVAAPGPALPATGRGPGEAARPGTDTDVDAGPIVAPAAGLPAGPPAAPPGAPGAPGPAIAPGPGDPARPSSPSTATDRAGLTLPELPSVVLPPSEGGESGRLGTGPAVAPGTGPTSTTEPGSPPPPVACPSDSGRGALAHGVGALQAVDFVLPWPGLGPLYLVPQASATRSAGATVRIMWASAGGLSADGSSLALLGPAALDYTLAAGQETAQGSIRFTAAAVPVVVRARACVDRRFALYDVAQASLAGSPLRIVGVVAPSGVVTVDGDGGTAHFRTSTPGTHTVVLLTANDAGAAGPLVTVAVDVA